MNNTGMYTLAGIVIKLLVALAIPILIAIGPWLIADKTLDMYDVQTSFSMWYVIVFAIAIMAMTLRFQATNSKSSVYMFGKCMEIANHEGINFLWELPTWFCQFKSISTEQEVRSGVEVKGDAKGGGEAKFKSTVTWFMDDPVDFFRTLNTTNHKVDAVLGKVMEWFESGQVDFIQSKYLRELVSVRDDDSTVVCTLNEVNEKTNDIIKIKLVLNTVNGEKWFAIPGVGVYARFKVTDKDEASEALKRATEEKIKKGREADAFDLAIKTIHDDPSKLSPDQKIRTMVAMNQGPGGLFTQALTAFINREPGEPKRSEESEKKKKKKKGKKS